MAVLELAQISKSYGGKVVLRDVTTRFPVGLTLLTGPSGAGKSTLLRLLATAERPSAGRMNWDGRPLPAGRGALRRVLGYAPQAVDLPNELTAREFARHLAALKGLNLAQADDQFGVITNAVGLHPDINSRIATFSGGMRRRLIFAQAMLGEPKFLALDEPTAELDRDTAPKLSALIVERARTSAVVMTTHLADELAPHAIAILRVDGGKVVTA